ncbi:hypothetical protein [Fusibacter tunisiensis]|uniref:Formate hydrogenlyase subunit 3/multisubunit Na+/H+ antiporter MnhD subunit n=1 Tax=Fusibacter tunisiensis TaxID=1008308 RepID=A0ABS2MQZ3_9FIRM|nr:hypothetical protein [Fusibacter tunisiensis]MBM7561834.1 formate hydrogenlyase subunit 3/multisubunit Na+/H+ antiporter MnhD subunit [Fusibacter tunisiensis]
MRQYGLVYNGKKVFAYYVLLIIGLALIFGGIISFYNHRQTVNFKLSDEEIIERARDLGMIELKEQLNNGEKDDSSQ